MLRRIVGLCECRDQSAGTVLRRSDVAVSIQRVDIAIYRWRAALYGEYQRMFLQRITLEGFSRHPEFYPITIRLDLAREGVIGGNELDPC